MRRTVAVPGSEHCDADSLSRQSATLGSEGEGRVALDGIVRTVDAFFRHWDDTEKMWSEYERGGFRLVVIGGELRLFAHGQRRLQLFRRAADSSRDICIAGRMLWNSIITDCRPLWVQ